MQNTSVLKVGMATDGECEKKITIARTQAISVFDGKSKWCEVIKSDLVQYIFLSGSPDSQSAERRETWVFISSDRSHCPKRQLFIPQQLQKNTILSKRIQTNTWISNHTGESTKFAVSHLFMRIHKKKLFWPLLQGVGWIICLKSFTRETKHFV
jgi:hypothetical protein